MRVRNIAAFSLCAALAAVVCPPGGGAEPLPGQIVIDPEHPAWLMRHGGRHVFLCGPGDPEDFLYRGRRNPDGTRDGDQADLIRKLVEHGGNCIYLQAVRSHGGDGGPDHNPFVDSDPAKWLDKDILGQWEEWFELMDRNGILIYFFFYDDGARIWKTGDRVGPEEGKFIEGIVGRFQHHKNLIWVVGEEAEEAYSTARSQAIAAVIRGADQCGHIVGNHHQSGTTFKSWQPGGALGHFSMQLTASGEAAHKGAVEAFRKAKGKYQVIYAESTAAEPDAKHAWRCATGGLMPMMLKMDIAGTPAEALRQCRYLQEFFEATDFYTMAPHDELAHGGTQWVLADPPRSYILYAEDLRGEFGLQGVKSGDHAVTWLDCRTGATKAERRRLGDGEQTLGRSPFGPWCAAWVRRDDPGPGAGEREKPAALFPGKTWAVKKPEEVGLDPQVLRELARLIGGDGVVIRDGYLVFAWGDPARRGDWASAAKPVLSTLLFFAVHAQKLPGVDAPVRPWVRRRWPGQDLEELHRGMTFRHLADMTSGYARGEASGTHYAYNDYAIQLYALMLEEVYGKSLKEAAREQFARLQLEDGDLLGSRKGYGVQTSPRDFARVGWLWLNRGNWDGTQLLPAEFFDKYLRPDVPAGLPRTKLDGKDYLGVGSYGGGTDQNNIGPGVYGFNWWYNAPKPGSDELFVPHLPPDAFHANGHGGREVVLVIPSQRLVVAARGNWGGTDLPRTKTLPQAWLRKSGAGK